MMLDANRSESSLSTLSRHSSSEDRYFTEVFASRAFKNNPRQLRPKREIKVSRALSQNDLEASIGGSFASASEMHKRTKFKDDYRNLVYGTKVTYAPIISLFYTLKRWHRRFIWTLKSFINSCQFKSFIMFSIMLNTVFLALYNPLADHYSYYDKQNEIIEISENIFLTIFAVEAAIKILAFGFFYPEDSAYLRNPWNLMDGALVLIGFFTLFAEGGANLSALRSFRLLRTFRGMKSMSKSLSKMTQALLTSALQLFYAVILLLIFFTIFGLMGVTLFRGSLTQYCTEKTEENLPFELDVQQGSLIFQQTDTSRLCSEFPSEYGRVCPDNMSCHRFPSSMAVVKAVSFDTFFKSAFTVFQILTLEGWSTTMHNTFDTSPWYFSVYYYLVIILGPMCILNLFVIILSINYNEINTKHENKHLIEDSAIEARKIFSDIAIEAKKQREIERRKQLQLNTRKMQMRLMYSYEKGFKSITQKEYEQYRQEVTSLEYEEWKKVAVPAIEMKERAHRLNFLRNSNIFKRVNSMRQESFNDTATTSVSSIVSPKQKEVRFSGQQPGILLQLQKSFSMELPRQDIGLKLFNPRISSRRKISRIAEQRGTAVVEEALDTTDDVAETEMRVEETSPVEESIFQSLTAKLEQDLILNDEEQEELQKAEQQILIDETKKLIERAQSLMLDAEDLYEVKQPARVKEALHTLRDFLEDPEAAQNKKGLKSARMLLSVRTSSRKPKQRPSNKPEHDVALGLLTDNVTIRICYRIVTNLWFKRIIVVLIAINVLMLSFIEFDMNPSTLHLITEVNFVFTIIFFFEMCIKIYALGGTFYFKDYMNFVDFCIIFPAMIGLLVSRSYETENPLLTVISNLRVFRLFQVMTFPQLQPYTKSFQKLIRTMAATVNHVCPFFILLLLFLLLFTILGLHLFGGKLHLLDSELNYRIDSNHSTSLDSSSFDPSSDLPRVYNYVDCILLDASETRKIVHCPARSNYDDFLWSFVSTFQVITLENWNDILENALRTEPSLVGYTYFYFIALVTVGVFILLQLFLAVVIDSFNALHSDRLDLLKQAWVREHQRTKEQVIPSEEADNNLETLAQKLESQRISNKIQFDPSTHPAFDVSSLCVFGSNNRFRRACAIFINNKYVETFIVGCIFLSCIMLALDSENSLVYGVNLSLVIIFNIEVALKVISFGLFMSKHAYLRDPWNALDFLIAVVMTASYLFISGGSGIGEVTAVKLLRSFRVLRPLRVVRRFESLRIVVRTLFVAVIPCFWVLILCLVVYWIGGVISIGLFGGELRSCYTCTDNTCLRTGLIDCSEQPFGCPVLSSFDTTNETIFNDNTTSLPRYCFNYRSYNSTEIFENFCGTPEERVICPGAWMNSALYSSERLYHRYRSASMLVNFESVREAMRVLFEVSMLEGWPFVMYLTTDISGVGVDMERNASPYNSIFWVAFLTITKLMLLPLLVAMIIESFLLTNDKETGSAFMSPSQIRWVEARQRATRSRPKKNSRIYSMYFYRIATHQYFDTFVSTIVFLNTIFLIFFQYETHVVFILVDIFFAIVYLTEAFIKLKAFGWQGYFREKTNLFDFVIVSSITVEMFLNYVIFPDNNSSSSLSSSILKNVEILRVMRVSRLLYKIEGVADILNTLLTAIPSFVNIFFVLFLALFMFTVLGVDLFKDVFPNDDIEFVFLGEYTNFNSFKNSMSTLTRMATGESWNGIMHDLQKGSDNAFWFCAVFMLIFQFLLMNLFVAVVLSSFMLSYDKLKNDRAVEKNIKQFSSVWTHRSRLWGRRMRQRLRQDMGIVRSGSIISDDGLSLSTVHRSEPLCLSFAQHKENFKREKIIKHMVKEMKEDDYLPYTEFTSIIKGIPPPLGIKGLGIEHTLSEAETMKLVAKVNIPVTKTGLINYQQTLFALVDHALVSESIPHQVQQFLDYRLPQREVDQRKQREEATASHSLQELYAAARLQLVLRNYLAVRKLKKLRQQGYSPEKISELIVEARNKATAAKVFTKWLQPVD